MPVTRYDFRGVHHCIYFHVLQIVIIVIIDCNYVTNDCYCHNYFEDDKVCIHTNSYGT